MTPPDDKRPDEHVHTAECYSNYNDPTTPYCTPDSPDSQAVDVMAAAIRAWDRNKGRLLTQDAELIASVALEAMREQGWGPQEYDVGLPFKLENCRAQLSAAQEERDKTEDELVNEHEAATFWQSTATRLEAELTAAQEQERQLRVILEFADEKVERLERERDRYREKLSAALHQGRELGDKLIAAQVALEMTMEERDEARKQADA